MSDQPKSRPGVIRGCTWNLRRATRDRTAVWEYLDALAPDIALLQEVNSMPESFSSQYACLSRSAQRKEGAPQEFSTVVLVRGHVEQEIELSSSHDWVRDELRRFEGNLMAAELVLEAGPRLRTMAVYNPAWPIDRSRLDGVDVSDVKLTQNPDVWVTELMWDALRNQPLDECPWIVAGDLNSSVTFDTMWGDGPRGNQEIQDRMAALGFVECLRAWQGKLTPTFRHSKGTVIHQIDHLFATASLAVRLTDCRTGDPAVVFDGGLSDHLPIIADFHLAG